MSKFTFAILFSLLINIAHNSFAAHMVVAATVSPPDFYVAMITRRSPTFPRSADGSTTAQTPPPTEALAEQKSDPVRSQQSHHQKSLLHDSKSAQNLHRSPKETLS